MSPHEKVNEAVTRARAAHAAQENWSQEVADDVVAAVAWSCYREEIALELAVAAVEETGFGDVRQLYELHRRRMLGVLRDLQGVRTTGVVQEIPESGIVKLAKPVGVIAVASPATAPCTSVVVIALQALKTRNAVVFCPNPAALGVVRRTVAIMRDALRAAGADPDVIHCLDAVDRETCTELMSAADLVVATGGKGSVRRAYASGTPALGAGVGNPTIIVDETADLVSAAQHIAAGTAFNNGTSCSSESNVLVESTVRERFLELLGEQGAHLCSPEEAARLRAVVWDENGKLRRTVVGRDARTLAAAAGIDLTDTPGVRFLVVSTARVDVADCRFGEKLTPVLTVTPYTSFADAVGTVADLTERTSPGHSCGIHSHRRDRVDQLAERVKVCRVIVNQSTALANSGSFANGLEFTSVLSGGTWGGTALSENVTWRHFLNHTWVSTPLRMRQPDEAVLFGRHRTPARNAASAARSEEVA